MKVEKYIGIITAMDEEMLPIKKRLENLTAKTIYDLTFYEGTVGEKRYALVKSSIGKVNAGRSAQIMIDNYRLEYIINIGSAGSLNDNLNICDWVIGREIVQHDADITAFGHKKGYIPNVGEMTFSSEELIQEYIEKIQDVEKNSGNGSKVVIGKIATGDSFCTDISLKERLQEEFGADCIEMEAGAIGQVCTLCDMPFIAVKSISDKPNGENVIEYEKFIEIVSKKCAEIIF